MSQRIVLLDDIVQMDTGAPEPIVVASEDRLLIAFFAAAHAEGQVCVLNFKRPLIYKFGAPNDEVLEGHPLYSFGLQHYSLAEVENSAWVDELKARNSVHPHHTDAIFDSYRHFVGTFHDSTIEIVAQGYEVMRSIDPLREAVKTMIDHYAIESGT